MPVTTPVRRLRQEEGLEFKISLSYIERPCRERKSEN
jgi:hypothetical protein